MFRFRAMPMHKPVCFAAVVLMALSTGGCREEALERGSSDSDGGYAAGLSPKQASLVLAKVGSEPITLGEFAATLERMDQFDRLRFKTPERRRELLEEMITVELLAKEAERRGLDKDPQTQEALRQILRDAILRDARKAARGPMDFSEQEVRAYFDAHQDQYREPERRRVSHLVVGDKAKAESLLELAKVLKTPAQWGEFVLQHSEEYKGKKYSGPVEVAGDLGLVGSPGDQRGDNPRVKKEVREAVFQIQDVGNMADRVVVDGEGGFHLVRLIGLTKSHTRTFAEAERTIRIMMSQQDVAAREKQLEVDLREKFPITIDEKALAETQMPTPNPRLPELNPPPPRHEPPPNPNGGQGHNHAH